MIEPHSELQWAQEVRARAASRRKAPVDLQTKRERQAAIVRAWRLRNREKLLAMGAAPDSEAQAPYPRGFALDREAFMAAFLAFWGIGGVAPDVAKRNGIEGVST